MSPFNKHTLCYNIETSTIFAISAYTFFSFSESLNISRCDFKTEMLIYIFKYIQLCPRIPMGPHFNKSSAVMVDWISLQSRILDTCSDRVDQWSNYVGKSHLPLVFRLSTSLLLLPITTDISTAILAPGPAKKIKTKSPSANDPLFSLQHELQSS